ncbi:helix-turn-helix transcriptional regulator [Chryseobacterium taeanense]|nr:helix-turn-helix transcriptional regulator [Chryseobacterium taeanense]
MQIFALSFKNIFNNHVRMIQRKLRNLRKQKCMSQEKMAKILSTDISSYCRKENGKSKIHDDEWEKLAKALNVSVDDIKESKNSVFVQNDNSTFNDNSGNYEYQKFNIPNSILENLQDYIKILKEQNESLKRELESFKNSN